MSVQLSIKIGIVCFKYNVEKLRICNADLRATHLRNIFKHIGNGKLKSINVSTNPKLGVEGVSVLGSMVSLCEIENVVISDCNLTAEAMKAFKENTRGAKLKKLNVSFNIKLGVEGVGVLGYIVSQSEVEEVFMRGCSLTAESMKAFKENARDAKIKLLHLSWNMTLGDEGLSTISEIVLQCHVETVVMRGCDFNDDQLKRFKALIADTGVKFIH
ncbi:ribonuclease inhibitor-like [Styela clava]